MRGRGETLEGLPAQAIARLRGRRIIVFKPAFGIPTPWAYARLAGAVPPAYTPPAEAEARLDAWIGDPSLPAEALLFNGMEGPAFWKYPALPVLLGRLREGLGLRPVMSGSGSACFALLPEGAGEAAGGVAGGVAAEAAALVREAWGAAAFVLDTRIA